MLDYYLDKSNCKPLQEYRICAHDIAEAVAILGKEELDYDDQPYSRAQLEQAVIDWLDTCVETLCADAAHYATSQATFQPGFCTSAFKLPKHSDIEVNHVAP